MFRRQKTLGEIGRFLKTRGFPVHGSSGLAEISRCLSLHLGQPTPQTKQDQWEFLAKFAGKTAGFANTKKARKKIQNELKKSRGAAEDFLSSSAWMRLRYEVLVERGPKCECCGATRADGIVIQVDHVTPRSLFPELALVKSNLQVLCRPCNMGKSNVYSTDWREDATLQ